jgi:TolB protein
MRVIALLLMMMAVFMTNPASAVLKIDINQGNVDPLPIALNEFLTPNGSTSSLGGQIREVVESNLASSGLFKSIDKNAFLEVPTVEKSPVFASWRQIGAFALTTGRIKEDGEKITIEFRLWDPNMEVQLEGTSFTLNKRSWRRAGHKIADQIYKRLTGEEGYFDTRILFVAETGSMLKRVKKLAIMDQDSENYKELTAGKELVLTPRFDPKVQRAIYLSYKNKTPQVYLLDIQTGQQKLIGNFPGMSFSPRFAPDGNKAAMSIAKDGTTEVYEIDLESHKLKKLTSSIGTINTSPTYSPDGSKIAFNSDRGGSPQIYVMDRDGSGVKRISFGDGSYSTPVWSPRGDYIAFTKKKGSQFYIGVMRSDGSGERLLTSSWMDEGPSWAPNGRVIVFSRQSVDGGYKLYKVDITGYNLQAVETATDASDPAWSPLLG